MEPTQSATAAACATNAAPPPTEEHVTAALLSILGYCGEHQQLAAEVHFKKRMARHEALRDFLGCRIVDLAAGLRSNRGTRTNNNEEDGAAGDEVKVPQLLEKVRDLEGLRNHTITKIQRLPVWEGVVLEGIRRLAAPATSPTSGVTTLVIQVMPTGCTVTLKDVNLSTFTVDQLIEAVALVINYPALTITLRKPGSDAALPRSRVKSRKDVPPSSPEDVDSDEDPEEPLSPREEVAMTLACCWSQPQQPASKDALVLHATVDQGGGGSAGIPVEGPRWSGTVVRKAAYPQGWKDLLAQFDGSTALLSLDPKTVKGGGLSVDACGRTASKTVTSHCCVLGNRCFDRGTVSWKVQLSAPRPTFAGEYWIFLGVTSQPAASVPLDGARACPGLWGISCHSNNNSWEYRNGAGKYGVGHNAVVEPGEVITVTLNCDTGVLTWESPKWRKTMEGLPIGVSLTPFFDPYDLCFSIAE